MPYGEGFKSWEADRELAHGNNASAAGLGSIPADEEPQPGSERVSVLTSCTCMRTWNSNQQVLFI